MDILLGESKVLEYKSTFTKNILKTVSAFANFHDGMIVIGITDDKTLVGVDNPEELRLNIENSINDNLKPCPYYEISTQFWLFQFIKETILHIQLIIKHIKGRIQQLFR